MRSVPNSASSLRRPRRCRNRWSASPYPNGRAKTARLDDGTTSIDEIIIESDPVEGGLPDPSQPPDLSLIQEDVAQVQILLDRLGLSPGVIDGRMGDNVNKAISTYREMTGRSLRTYDKDSIEELLQETGGRCLHDLRDHASRCRRPLRGVNFRRITVKRRAWSIWATPRSSRIWPSVSTWTSAISSR